MAAPYRLYLRKDRSSGADTWWLDARLGAGRRHRGSLRTSDRGIAEARASAWWSAQRSEEIASALGLETHQEARNASVLELLRDYGSELERRGTGERQRRLVLHRCSALADLVGATDLAGLTTERISKALPTLRVKAGCRTGPRSRPSARTRNRYVEALSSLFEWLIAARRWTLNPCSGIEPARVISEEERRALTPGELARLLETAPAHRGLVYRVAVTTGLRRSELATLRVEDLDLEALTYTVRAGRAKSRKAATRPIPPDTIAAWRPWLESPREMAVCLGVPRDRALVAPRIESGLALPAPPQMHTFYADLARAGIEPRAGAILDFHALRVTFITNLARAGVPLQRAQWLARHSSPELTARIYTKLDLADGRDDVAALDALLAGVPPGVPHIGEHSRSPKDLRDHRQDLKESRKNSRRMA